MYTTTGTPMNGVMADKGSVPRSPGKWVSNNESNATLAPITKVAGNKRRWSAVCMSRRTICGTAKPMNDMGPHRAVTAAVSSPVSRSRMVRTRLTRMPRLVA